MSPVSDLFAWVASALFVGASLAAAHAARRLGVPADVTRKAHHAALGTWALAAVRLFEPPSSAAGLYLAVAALAYASFRLELFPAVEDDGPSLGSVFLPLSAAALLALFAGENLHIGLAGILAVAWGDAAAALIGRRLGSRKYRLFGHARTMEGTLSLFLVSSATMALVLGLLGGVDWHRSFAFALITGTVAASVETVSPYGTDNLTVPFASAATLWVLLSASA